MGGLSTGREVPDGLWISSPNVPAAARHSGVCVLQSPLLTLQMTPQLQSSSSRAALRSRTTSLCHSSTFRSAASAFCSCSSISLTASDSASASSSPCRPAVLGWQGGTRLRRLATELATRVGLSEWGWEQGWRPAERWSAERMACASMVPATPSLQRRRAFKYLAPKANTWPISRHLTRCRPRIVALADLVMATYT